MARYPAVPRIYDYLKDNPTDFNDITLDLIQNLLLKYIQ